MNSAAPKAHKHAQLSCTGAGGTAAEAAAAAAAVAVVALPHTRYRVWQEHSPYRILHTPCGLPAYSCSLISACHVHICMCKSPFGEARARVAVAAVAAVVGLSFCILCHVSTECNPCHTLRRYASLVGYLCMYVYFSNLYLDQSSEPKQNRMVHLGHLHRMSQRRDTTTDR